MLKVLLYGLVAFLETGIGVWVFGKMFPKRKCMEKRHIFFEWILFTIIMAGAYTFPMSFLAIAKKPWYIRTLIVAYFIILFFYVFYKKKKGKMGSQIVEAILFMGMGVWIGCQYWIAYESYTITILGNIVPVFFLYVFYQCSLVQAYLWEFLYLINMGLIKMIYVVYEGTLNNKHFEEFFLSPRIHLYSECIYLLVVNLIILLFVKNIPINRIIEKILGMYKRALFVVALGEWGILLVFMNFGEGTINQWNLTTTLIMVAGIVISFSVVLVKSFGNAIDTERKLLAVRNEAVECQYRELSNSYEKYRCIVHDEKHMVFYLRECLESGEVEKAIKFLNKSQDNIDAHGKRSWTGISTLDFMLNMKKRIMDELSIKFGLDCRVESIPMEDADFIIILGNLFDNAIESAGKCEIGKRKIVLSIQSINQMFIMRLNNTSTKKPNIKNNRFITSKEDMNKHGWGIESVKQIVNKYNGHLTFQFDASYFEISLIVNEQQIILFK